MYYQYRISKKEQRKTHLEMCSLPSSLWLSAEGSVIFCSLVVEGFAVSVGKTNTLLTINLELLLDYLNVLDQIYG